MTLLPLRRAWFTDSIQTPLNSHDSNSRRPVQLRLRWNFTFSSPLSGPKIPAAVVSILASHRVHLDHAHMRHWSHFPAPGVLLVRFPPRGNAVGRNEQCTDGIVPGRTCQRAPSSFRVGSTHTLLLPQSNLLRWLSS